jgi:uncharacterized membrane-anchored protein
MNATLVNGTTNNWLNKVPEIAISFWVIKIMSTTVGETGADFLAVNVGWGQAVTSLVMAALLGTASRRRTRDRDGEHGYADIQAYAQAIGEEICDLCGRCLVHSAADAKLHAVDLLAHRRTGERGRPLAAIFLIWYGVERTLSIHDIVTRRALLRARHDGRKRPTLTCVKTSINVWIFSERDSSFRQTSTPSRMAVRAKDSRSWFTGLAFSTY